ncbi:hypothetical protein [Bacterioplanoides sp.]|uniref:hypothetical protein n=1 Tax=Bacterioplanoides sp. TaxID=2066072 RepID=UPI003B5C724F
MTSTKPASLFLLCLCLSLPVEAFYFVQGFNHSLRQQDGFRAGYHNEDPDLFWRSYLSYSPSLGKSSLPDDYAKTDLSLDWVLPLPGSYSSAFVGGTINLSGHRSVQAGITWLKYLETGWQWREGESSSYLGLNLSF